MMRSLSLAAVLAVAAAMPALAQTSTTPSTSTTPPAATASKPGDVMHMTAEQAKAWIGKPVYSSDNTKLGEVAAFTQGSDGKVNEMQADIGGFLGIGETRVKVMPSQFTLQSDRVVLNETAAQAKSLPKVAK